MYFNAVPYRAILEMTETSDFKLECQVPFLLSLVQEEVPVYGPCVVMSSFCSTSCHKAKELISQNLS